MAVKRMAGHLIRRLHQTSTQVFANRMQKDGINLTPVQFAALDAIRAYPGADQARIAAQIAYDKATIGGVIDRLEKKGLVTRTISDRDKRARVITLSREGQDLFTEMRPVVSELQSDILKGLDPLEREQFLTLATKALSAFEKAERS